MNILQKYLVKSYVSAFFLGMLVLTFVLSIGILVKATQLVVKGLDPKLIGGYVLVSVPETFSFTIPLAVLVSALLVFGRMSTDGEISAMKACGINIWNVVMPLVGFGILMTAVSIFVNSYVSPKGYFKRHLISSSVQGTSALKLLEPGHFIEDFPKMTFWFAEKNGDMLYNVLIYDKSTTNFTREIRAEKARVTTDDNDITLDMTNVRVDPFSDPQSGAATASRMIHTIKNAITERQYRPKVGGFLNGELLLGITNLTVKIDTVDSFLADGGVETGESFIRAVSDVPVVNDYDSLCGGFLNDESLEKITNATVNIYSANAFLADRREALALTRAKIETLDKSEPSPSRARRRKILVHDEEELTERIAEVEGTQTARLESLAELRNKFVRRESELKTELSRRFALGITPIVFLLIGIPLGMKTSRKESNIGVAISIGVMILYYALMILAKGQAKNAAIYPHLIIWFAPAVCIFTAILLIRRNR